MGSNYSRQTSRAITNVVNSAIMQFNIDQSSTIQQYSNSQQNIIVRLRGITLTNGNINVRQITNNFLSALMSTENKLSTNMMTTIQNEIMTQLEQEVEQLNEGFNFLQSNVSIQDAFINNKIKNIVRTSIDATFNNMLQQSTTNVQNIDFFLEDARITNGNIDLSQEAIVENMAQQFTSNAIEAVMKTDLGNDITNSIEQSASQANIGLSLGGLLIIIIIAVVAFIMFKKFLLKFIIIMAVIAIVLLILYIILVVTGILPNPVAPKESR